MSAAICGKRSFFEEPFPGSPLVKRARCLSVSWTDQNGAASFELQPSSSLESLFALLSNRFPDMDSQEIQKAIDAYGNDLDSAIEYLRNLQLSSHQPNAPLSTPALNSQIPNGNSQASAAAANDVPAGGAAATTSEAQLSSNPDSSQDFPSNVTDWVELFIHEMMAAGDVDIARMKVAKAMELFEAFIAKRNVQLYSKLDKENGDLKATIQTLMNENQILKRAVAIQHDRQKNHESEMAELNKLKEMLAAYHEKIRILEMNNYALTVHLKTAQGNSSMPNHFNPDIY